MSPRFPRHGSRSRTPAQPRAAPSIRRSACRHASTTSRACARSRSANDPLCSAEKQITSQRPCPACRSKSETNPSPSRGLAATGPARLGNRFSKTTTSYSGAGTSLVSPVGPGHSGHRSGVRLVGAVLAVFGDDHPLAGSPVVAQMRRGGVTFGQRPTIRHRRWDVPGQREEQQVTAIGQSPPRRRRQRCSPLRTALRTRTGCAAKCPRPPRGRRVRSRPSTHSTA